jgi:hypothetical protein
VPDQLQLISGVPVLVCGTDGAAVDTGTVLELIGDALGRQAEWVAVPISRLDRQFVTLRSGVTGEVVQKLTNYRLRLAVLGDITAYTAASESLRDWVREANRRGAVWFVTDLDELAGRLAETR